MRLPNKILDEIPAYKNSLSRFLAGEMQDAFFRGIRVPWGFYSQRGGKLLMARIRVPGGILTPLQLDRIGRAANIYGDGALHITTRQDIQIHNLPLAHTHDLIEYLQEAQLSPRAGGGNTVRNITCCYRSGICVRERREVYRIVWALTEYLLSRDETYTMPRKIKIAFSGCERDCACTGVNDIGFIALDDGFKVLCGGGMGAKSMVGKVLHEAIAEADVGSTVKAIINVFNAHGERKKRHRNRLRFLIEDLGWERFRELYRKELQKVNEGGGIALNTVDVLPPLPPLKDGPHIDDATLQHDNAYVGFLSHHTEKQRQAGYYSILVRIPRGEIRGDTLIQLARLGETTPSISFRTTQRQDLILVNVPVPALPLIYENIKDLFPLFPSVPAVVDSICCKGATTCNLGICNTMGLASEIMSALADRQLDPEVMRQVMININGCPNACGQHPIGLISFSGVVKKVYNRSVPFYRIHLGGRVDGEKTVLAEPVGAAPARVIPAVLREFIVFLHQQWGNKDVYHTITTQGKAYMHSLIERHASLPLYEEDPAFYRDFGRTDDFSLAGLTQGECGSGVIDMIESDLESAGRLLAEMQGKGADVLMIRRALIFAARALLVVRGVDPQDEHDVISAFIQQFVRTGICSPDFKNLKEVFQALIAGTMPQNEAFDYVNRLYREVGETYALIDNNFSFPVRYGDAPSLQAAESAWLKPSAVYDLRGIPCPLNYVKAKLKLESLERGALLELYLDEGEPSRSVPASLHNDGQEIISIEKQGAFYKIVIRKQV